jgi:hypothetical protein
MSKFSLFDGIKSLVSSIVNTRQVTETNTITAERVNDHELRAIMRNGLGSKIIRIKNGYALKDEMVFETPGEQKFFKKKLRPSVKKAGGQMLAFGRSIILINESGADHSSPMTKPPEVYKLDVFSGDMVSITEVSTDLSDERYNKPKFYNVRGVQFHHSRVVDFRYVEPPEFDLPTYRYGGISEFELIYAQMVNDGIVERCAPATLEKNSTLFYKVKGFKDALQAKQEKDILEFFSSTEKARSMFGAGIVDADDDVINVDQTLTNLDGVDQITLRRLAMVTSIPLAILIGENVKGLNSTGENEMQVWAESIETLQQDFYLDPINELLEKLGLGVAEFSKVQNTTPSQRAELESKFVSTAKMLWEMGEDAGAYLESKEIIAKDDFSKFFEEPEEDENDSDAQ